MDEPTLDRDRLLRSLPLDTLPQSAATSQTITPLAYARTAAAGPLHATWAADPPPALPRITIGEARESAAPDGDHDLQVVRVLGEGGMGVVSLALQRSLAREVAIKTVRASGESRLQTGALLHEAVITGALEHPSIVPVHALGTDASGRPIMVMKRIEGTVWRDLLVDPEHPAWRELVPGDDDRLGFHLEILEQVCNALRFAHDKGFVHRDMKPDNVMIGSFGEVYLLDWGIATRRRSREECAALGAPDLVGTPAYMAPEMITQEECTERTDMYLLGATLHEILTGRPRHDGETVAEALEQALASASHTYDAAVPAELAALCNRATAADPALRPASALEFRQALREFRRHRSSIAAARAALERLDQLEPLLPVAKIEDPVRMRVHKLFAECRFGLTHALKEWPENPAARAGLERALSAMAAHEIERENLGSAEALLAEMEGLAAPPPSLVERLAAARERHAEKLADAERLRGFARDHDPRVGSRARGAVIVAMGVFGIAVSAYVLRFGGRMGVDDQAAALELAVVYGSALAALVFAFRRQILANRFGRKLAALQGTGVALMIVHRAVALSTREPIPLVLANDMLLLALALLAVGIAVQRAFFWFGLIAAVNAVAIALLPQHAQALFSPGAVLAIPVGWVSWKRAARGDTPGGA